MGPTRLDDLPAAPGRGAGRLRGKFASAALGAGATSSAPVTVACSRTAATTSAVVVRVWSSMFVETCTRSRAGRPSARTSSSLPQALRDRLGRLDRRVDLDVERDQRGPRGDEGRAGRRVQLARPEVGGEVLAGRRAGAAPRGSARRPARRRGTRGRRAARARRRARAPRRTPRPCRPGQVDDRRDVDRSHPRVHAAWWVRSTCSIATRAPVEHLRVQLARPPDEREHRAVVVGVAGPVHGRERAAAMASSFAWSRPSETLGTEISTVGA